jgi:hypothetical protein
VTQCKIKDLKGPMMCPVNLRPAQKCLQLIYDYHSSIDSSKVNLEREKNTVSGSIKNTEKK